MPGYSHRLRCLLQLYASACQSQTRPSVVQPFREAHQFIVLAALDGSDSDHEALREGANLARAVYDGALHVLFVLDPEPPPLADLAAEACILFQDGQVVLHVASGAWAKAVLVLADELRADLLVTGPSSHPRLLRGSGTDRVVHRARCPVLVARPTRYP
jgi:nucleotide-binding universal stress UspA family protein